MLVVIFFLKCGFYVDFMLDFMLILFQW